ncbi:transport and Golgi organization protein 2 [Phlebotomus argentipes]|uniref:transport and Golgi organization protein 2 n=1 Tax=Phlebotomus argentipes TaxID=94469 RepID=UPI00289298EA|nr:transport and Golgi organization protein 2 [Phlebotomus argentipes]XP_059611603.1 transport and Golgi organization protein 2 [Phlebotomus argentipes]
MCILFFVATANPSRNGYKLILAANRDEAYARPALPASAWTDTHPHVFGGRDMEPGREGGTWLALGSKNGVTKIGALLNITGEKRNPNALGRGPIVSNYVSGNLSNRKYSEQLVEQHEIYNSFNLVSIEFDDSSASILHTSNAPPGIEEFPGGEILGFGNSPHTIPLRKVLHGKEKFRQVVKSAGRENLVRELMEFLKDDEKHWPDAELSRRAPNWAEKLSSVCVKMPAEGYGSRTRTVILIDAQNRMDFHEETMVGTDPDGEWKHTHIQQQL